MGRAHRVLLAVSIIAYFTASFWALGEASGSGTIGTALVLVGLAGVAGIALSILLCRNDFLEIFRFPNLGAWVPQHLAVARSMAIDDMCAIGWMTMALATTFPLYVGSGAETVPRWFYPIFATYLIVAVAWAVTCLVRWHRGPRSD